MVCEVNLVKVQCVTVKLLTIMSNNSDVIEYKKNIKMIQKQLFSKISVVVKPVTEKLFTNFSY